MKKLIAIFAVLLFVAPAFAADWAFYGSERFATYWTEKYRANVTADGDTMWEMQGNSRIGAKVKAEKVSGLFELALRANPNGDVGGNDLVRTREMWGRWDFSDNGFLKIGKHLSILDFTEVSNQVYGTDNDLTGLAPAGRRTAAITLGLGGFQLSLVQPDTTNASDNASTNPQNASNAAGDAPRQTGTDANTNDVKLPKIEARYDLPIGSMFTLMVGGGYQYLEIGANAAGAPMERLNSYILQLGGKANIGAAYVKAAGFYGQNTSNAAWSIGGLGQVDARGSAQFKIDGKLEDATSFGGGGEAGLNFTDTIAFGAGGGYRVDEQEQASSKTEDWYNVYVNMTYKFAPGCKITPEVGYISREDSYTSSSTAGHDWYAGMQWRIDF